MRKIPFVQTSVFVDDLYPFGGNQLATFWDCQKTSALTKEEMQSIALEMNFSESTFLFSPTLKECLSKVRIFTPGAEIPFAGHPTLGTAFVIKHKMIVKPSSKSILIELGAGPVSVDFLQNEIIQMRQPTAEFLDEIEDVEEIVSALGLDESDIIEGVPIQIVSTGLPFIIIPLKTMTAVKRAVPDASSILTVTEKYESQEILIFSPEAASKERQVHARMFAPGVGVLEDPATGSAAGPLGAYIEKHEILKEHYRGQTISIEQGHEINRPSLLQVQVPDINREILVSGKVRLAAEGDFFVP